MQPNAISLPYTHQFLFLKQTASGRKPWTAYLPQHADPATHEDVSD
jgi:hypothetical protein